MLGIALFLFGQKDKLFEPHATEIIRIAIEGDRGRDELPYGEKLAKECEKSGSFAEIQPNFLASEWEVDPAYAGRWGLRDGVLSFWQGPIVLWHRGTTPERFAVTVDARTNSPRGPFVIVRGSRKKLAEIARANDLAPHDAGVWCGWGLVSAETPALGWRPGKYTEAGSYRVRSGRWHTMVVEYDPQTVAYELDGGPVLRFDALVALGPTPPGSDGDRIGIVLTHGQILRATVSAY